MKDELVNSIVCMLDSMDVDTDGIADRLYILLRNYEIKPLETQLADCDKSAMRCSECHFWKNGVRKTRFCPNCGAEMNGGDN